MAKQTGMATAEFSIRGVSPILLHSGQTADPRNEYAKALKKISAKRAKTDADYDEMAKIEWTAAIYATKEGRVIVPDYVMESALVSGARKLKLGKQFQGGVFVDDHCLLEFPGCELSMDELWERGQNTHSAPVRIGQQRVIRTRFVAEEWSTKIKLTYNTEMLDLPQIEQALQLCGSQTGLCDWRPKFGRFVVE